MAPQPARPDAPGGRFALIQAVRARRADGAPAEVWRKRNTRRRRARNRHRL